MAFDRLVGWDSAALVLPPDVVTYLDTRFINATGPETVTGNFTVTGTFTSTGTITTNNGSVIVDRSGDATTGSNEIRVDAGQVAQFVFRTGAAARWAFGKNNTAEGGANAGSNFDIDRFSDAGAFLGTPLSIVRSTGIATFEASPLAPTPAQGDSTTKMATTAFVANNVAGAPTKIQRQTLPAAETYVGSKSIAAGELTVGATYRMIFCFSNPATASTTTFRVKYGAAGTTADATIHTATYTGTAAADVAMVFVEVKVDTINAATGTINVLTSLQRNVNGTTGFHNVAGNPTATTQTATLDTTAARFLGVSIQETAATTVLLSATIEKIVA